MNDECPNRLEKGFNYESVIWDLLDNHGIRYKSNPKRWKKWLQHTNTDFDLRVKTIRKGWLRVECKFTSKPIYHSWFMRDWYSRNCAVIVTNSIWHIPYEDKILLQKKGVKLLSTYQFLQYILKLNRREGNKYYLNRCVNRCLFDVDYDVCQSVLTDYVGSVSVWSGVLAVWKRKRLVESLDVGDWA